MLNGIPFMNEFVLYILQILIKYEIVLLSLL